MDKYHLQKLFSKISKDLIKKKKEIINSFYAIVRSKDLFIYLFFFILMLFRRSSSVLFSLKDLIMLYKNIMGNKRGII